MFRRYPYWGWLLLSLLLWGIDGYDYRMHNLSLRPTQMVQSVANDINRREKAFETMLEEHGLIRRMFSDSLLEKEFDRINNAPFFLYGYEGDSLTFWNNNSVLATCVDSSADKFFLFRNERGVFIQKCVKPAYLEGQKRLVVLYPVLITYPLENDYLNSHFAASPFIPVKTKITVTGGQASATYPVKITASNSPLFYLQFNPQEIQKWTPNITFIILLIATVIISILWIQLMIIHLTRNRSPLAGLLSTVAIIALIRYLIFRYGLPFNLDTLTFFSPSLYASASSKVLTSLGDLFINILCVLWLGIFITRHTPYKTYFEKVQKPVYRYGLGILLTVGLHAYVYLFVYIIRSLVHDSRISFAVSHFYSINLYSILGLLIIGCITGISCLIIYLVNIQLRTLFKNNFVKFLLIGAIGAAMIFLAGTSYNHSVHTGSFDWRLYWALLGWLLLFVSFLEVKNFTLVSDLFEPHMIFWAVFICLFCTCLIQYFNELKELDTRKMFVQQNLQLSPQRDNYMEYDFNKKAKEIENDKQVRNFLIRPSAASRKTMEQHLNTQYLNGPAFTGYQSTVLIFDVNGNELFNRDTTDFNTLLAEKNESDSTSSSYLFYKEDFHNNHFYLSYIPIRKEDVNTVLGYVLVDLDLKKQPTETAVYPELLQAPGNNANTYENEYAYAIYVNRKLVSQNSDYPFTTYLKIDTLKEQEQAFYWNNNIEELNYKLANNQTVVVVHVHSEIMEMITLFSYLFGIQILLAIIILLYQLYLSYFARETPGQKLTRLTLRKRVHFSMLGVVLISFIIIGGVTIFFFTNQYKTSSNNKSRAALITARQSVQDYLKKEGAYRSIYAFDSVCRSPRVKTFIATIAGAQKIDINIYNPGGSMLTTSEDEIYNRGLLAPILRPNAYYQLNYLGKSIVIQKEYIADLSYLSAYEPIRNERGTTLGYINVPFFSSEKDLQFQISNIVVSLINLYAFIFLLSSLITVLITRWITGTFNMIIRQFERLNLQQNERISWPYEDEIGLLVREYNKMVNKVEENAALLAQSERETAWREMARQVAHEIKNPLTPMKLNIQYLQQAIKNDSPNIKELTNRVAYTMIEQIDNLSYIASEFSNFAKMPEARPEELELSSLLNKAVELYATDQHIKVSINDTWEKLLVMSDRSQLLRVFTNLLANAKQAIGEDTNGEIDVTVTSDKEYALVTITDNGPGIPEDVVKKLFQPYFTTKSSGTGLGLAMTKKIIEFWKGEIWFDTKEDEGTTFYVKLPLLHK